jgi:hypothetical protein
MPAESELEKKVCDYAKSKGAEVYKFTSPGRRGVPDRILLFRSMAVFIEFKAPNGKLSIKQEREIQKMKDLGQLVFVVDDEAKGKYIIDTVVNMS